MKAVDFSDLTEEDLESIGDFIAADNPLRAVTFVHEIRERCRNLAFAPKANPLRLDIGPDIRMAIHECYLIFYRETGDNIRIERVLHGARDYGSLF